jgi:6-phosphogluconate dehydrogenase (decarboxylating)
MPEATESVANELGDISRDLQNAAYQNPTGVQDLTEDISHYAQGTNGGEAAAQELARRLAQALTGKMFKVAQAMPVAHTVWVAVAARQLSEQQIDNLKNEMKSELIALGANEQQAQSAADQVGAVQQAVTARHRRWYERL